MVIGHAFVGMVCTVQVGSAVVWLTWLHWCYSIYNLRFQNARLQLSCSMLGRCHFATFIRWLIGVYSVLLTLNL